MDIQHQPTTSTRTLSDSYSEDVRYSRMNMYMEFGMTEFDKGNYDDAMTNFQEAKLISIEMFGKFSDGTFESCLMCCKTYLKLWELQEAAEEKKAAAIAKNGSHKRPASADTISTLGKQRHRDFGSCATFMMRKRAKH